MKWLWIVLAALVALAGALALVGAFLPREHSATSRARFQCGADALFAVLARVEGYPEWRRGVKAVRHVDPGLQLDPGQGKPLFVEETGEGARTYAIEASEPPHRLVLRLLSIDMTDEDLPFGGTWTLWIEPVGAGCRLSITEDGFVNPVIFRTLARFVFGYHATLEAYLEDLAKRMGETVTVERL